MKKTLLISTLAASFGLCMAFSAQAVTPIAGGKRPVMNVDGLSKASKEGGEKEPKGGKDKMGGAAMMKEGGDKEPKGGKDKMGGTAMAKEGGDKEPKGGKDKLVGGAMMKEGGDKEPKGGKDKLGGNAALKGKAGVVAPIDSKQMGGVQNMGRQ